MHFSQCKKWIFEKEGGSLYVPLQFCYGTTHNTGLEHAMLQSDSIRQMQNSDKKKQKN